jgi:hypothetical protein
MRRGAWIEHTEVDINVKTKGEPPPVDSEVIRLSNLAGDFTRASGRDWNVASKLKNMMEEAGFVDVKERSFGMPLGPWAREERWKRVGESFEQFYKTGIHGWLHQVSRHGLGVSLQPISTAADRSNIADQWTDTYLQQCTDRACREIESRQSHFYFPL